MYVHRTFSTQTFLKHERKETMLLGIMQLTDRSTINLFISTHTACSEININTLHPKVPMNMKNRQPLSKLLVCQKNSKFRLWLGEAAALSRSAGGQRENFGLPAAVVGLRHSVTEPRENPKRISYYCTIPKTRFGHLPKKTYAKKNLNYFKNQSIS